MSAKKKVIEYCSHDLAGDIVQMGFSNCTQLRFLLLVVVTGRSKLVCKLFLILRTYHSTAYLFLMKWLFGLLRWNNTLQLKRAKACRSKISNAAKVKTVNNGSLERTYCSEVNGDRKGSIAVSCKEAVQERRAAEKKERNRLHCQQNQEKTIERIKERRREIRESTTERAKHTRRTVKEIMEKKAVKQGRDKAHAKDLTTNLRKTKPWESSFYTEENHTRKMVQMNSQG